MAAYAEKYAMSNTVNKGYVTNCAVDVANFSMDWYPEPMVKHQDVTVEGNYTFPEPFESGRVEVEVKVGFLPEIHKTFQFDCSMISQKPCTQGYTAVGSRTMKLPEMPLPEDEKIKVTAILVNEDTGNKIGCAAAEIRIVDGKFIWNRIPRRNFK